MIVKRMKESERRVKDSVDERYICENLVYMFIWAVFLNNELNQIKIKSQNDGGIL